MIFKPASYGKVLVISKLDISNVSNTELCRYESFSYLSDELKFAWIENESTVNKNISLAQFDVQTNLVARLS